MSSLKRACRCVPQRIVLGLFCFLGLANAFIQRYCFSLAITELVSNADTVYNRSDGDTCPTTGDSVAPTNGTKHGGEFTWDQETQGLLLSAFFWGYLIMQLPGGVLAERIGGKITLAVGMSLSSVSTLLTPIVARECGPPGLIALRFAQGLGQAPIYPSINVLFAHWVPKHERGRFAGNSLAGSHVGSVISFASGGFLIYYGGWPSVFYVYGVIGLLWVAMLMVFCYDRPSENPYVSETEVEYLKNQLSDVTVKIGSSSTPWKSILTSVPVWSVIIVNFGHDWGLFTILTDLPKYMSSVLHFPVRENGLLAAMPHLMLCLFANICGWTTDWIVGLNRVSLKTVVTIFGTIGAVGPAIGILAASYAGCNRGLAAGFFALGMGLMGAYTPSIILMTFEMCPNYIGVLMGLVGGIGSISGIVVPYVNGLLTPNNAVNEWRVVFWIAGIWLVSTVVFFNFFGSVQLQPWNNPTVDQNKRDSKERDDKSGDAI